MRSVLLLILLVTLPVTLLGQEKNEVIRQRIEFVSEQLESDDLDLTNLLEQLYYYYDHPINLNQTTFDQLNSLGILTDIQITDIFNHMRLFGKFISLYELQSLPYWTINTIQLAMPFIRVDDRFDNIQVTLKEALKQGKIETFFRFQSTLEKKKAYTDVADSVRENSSSYYYGDPNRYYTRFRFSYRTNLSIGVTAEKDPGEQFEFNRKNPGFDFYSAHAFFQGGKYLRAIALGDYQVQIGQGLNLWSGYAFGKTADVTNVKKNPTPLKPYTSVDENRYLRGAAACFGFKSWQLLLFGSVKKIDATLVADSLIEEQEFISSINVSGLHRTFNEISRKNSFEERITGANFKYIKGSFSAGITSVYQGFNRAYSKSIQPYNQFDFRGESFVSTGVDYNYVIKNVSFFGEAVTQSSNQSTAILNGILIALDPSVSFSILYRNYQKGYQTLYNAGFAEASTTQNEKGTYAGMAVRLGSNWSIQSYADFFTFPWLKYLVDAPSQGHEFLIQPIYKPNKQLEIYGRFREQVRQKNSRNQDGTVTELEDVRQRNYRLNLSLVVADGIQLKSRVEYIKINRLSNNAETGVLIYQDLIIRPKAWPIDLSLRYAIFQTDSYDSRIYAYESNALYVFSVPGYYYKGSRAYALIRYTIGKHLDLWLRYAVTIYTDRTKIGSGAEEISGNQKSDVTVQLRVTF